jgi:predicted metal-dependent phosphoesterase TrpH
MYKANYECDMHCHTLRSDGNDTPEQLINSAAEVGLKVIGITDHDVPPPLKISSGNLEYEICEYGRSKGIIIVPGYEFSCDKWVEDVHICGYGLCWSNPGLLAEVDAAAKSKSNAYRELCECLTQNGMPIDWEADVLRWVDQSGTVQRREPEEVQRKHVFEAMAARGHVKSWSDGKILVQSNPHLNVQRRKIDPAAAIKLIHDCCGIAVLSHPYLIDEKIERPGEKTCLRYEYIMRLFDAGLDGIEVRYPYDKTSYKGSMTPEQIEVEVRKDFLPRAQVVSGGSDYHADHRKKDAKKIRQLGEKGISLEEFKMGFGKKLDTLGGSPSA